MPSLEIGHSRFYSLPSSCPWTWTASAGYSEKHTTFQCMVYS